MRTKDSYQEHMLGYLGGVQTEIEELEQSRIRLVDLIELYNELDTALEYLWQLIGASDADWEQFRFTLEASCDDLLQAFYGVLLHSGKLRRPAFVEVHESKVKALIMKRDVMLRAKR